LLTFQTLQTHTISLFSADMHHQLIDLFGLTAFSFTLYKDCQIYNSFEELVKSKHEDPRDIYLTGWQVRASILFYIFSLMTHLIDSKLGPRSGNIITYNLARIRDTIWISMMFPLGLLVSILFWTLYHIDRDLVFPVKNDEYFPSYVNHLWHTLPLLIRVYEVFMIKRVEWLIDVNGKKTQIALLSAFVSAYITRICYYHSWSGMWPYAVIDVFWDIGVHAFVGFSAVVFMAFLGFNRLANYIGECRFREFDEKLQFVKKDGKEGIKVGIKH